MGKLHHIMASLRRTIYVACLIVKETMSINFIRRFQLKTFFILEYAFLGRLKYLVGKDIE